MAGGQYCRVETGQPVFFIDVTGAESRNAERTGFDRGLHPERQWHGGILEASGWHDLRAARGCWQVCTWAGRDTTPEAIGRSSTGWCPGSRGSFPASACPIGPSKLRWLSKAVGYRRAERIAVSTGMSGGGCGDRCTTGLRSPEERPHRQWTGARESASENRGPQCGDQRSRNATRRGEGVKAVQVPYCYHPDAVGGTEIYVETLARELSARGLDVTIAAPGDATASYPHRGLWWVHRFAVSRKPENVVELYGEGDSLSHREFASILDELKPDVVHLHAFTRAVSARGEGNQAAGNPGCLHVPHPYGVVPTGHADEVGTRALRRGGSSGTLQSVYVAWSRGQPNDQHDCGRPAAGRRSPHRRGAALRSSLEWPAHVAPHDPAARGVPGVDG